jgi:hypothetical protein
MAMNIAIAMIIKRKARKYGMGYLSRITGAMGLGTSIALLIFNI